MFCFITRLFSFFIGKDKFLVLSYRVPIAQENLSLVGVEGLNCKRPVQCLAFTKILTTHTPSPPGECGAGEDTLAGCRGGRGSIFWKTPDTALYSTYASTLCLHVFRLMKAAFFLLKKFTLAV
jgi:hypothetical protein